MPRGQLTDPINLWGEAVTSAAVMSVSCPRWCFVLWPQMLCIPKGELSVPKFPLTPLPSPFGHPQTISEDGAPPPHRVWGTAIPPKHTAGLPPSLNSLQVSGKQRAHPVIAEFPRGLPENDEF